MRLRQWLTAIRQQWQFIIYVFIGVLLRPSELAWNRQLLFFAYFLLLFFTINFLLRRTDNKNRTENKQTALWGYLMLFSFIFILITRLIPFYQFGEAPLGYDTGFYLRNFYVNDSSFLSSSAYYLNLVPLHIFGLSPLHAISFIYVISQLLIAGGLYILFRSTKTKDSSALAAIAIFLFSISALQFYAYWWMLGQQMIATAFLLITIALLFRHPLLAIFTGAAGFLFHLPTFGLFALSFFVFSLINIVYCFARKKEINSYLIKLFIIGACLSIIIIVFKGALLWQYFNEYIIEHKGLYNTFPFWEIVRFKGAFLSVSTLSVTSIVLLPFTVYGLLKPSLWKLAFNTDNVSRSFIIFLYVSFFILLPLVIFPVIYQQRFMIILDLFIIIFATPVLYLLISRFANDKIIKIIMFLFLACAFYNVGAMAWKKQPQIPPEELQEIKSLSMTAESDAFIIATNSFYTPWIYGFGGRKSYGPGWGPDPWGYDSWMEFWRGSDEEAKMEMINSTFASPTYFFIGAKQQQGFPFQIFIEKNEKFINISPHVWKFTPSL
ncbi:hypothetical protein HZB94_02775 [Candidatus Falkowbacteria bacterium]|nr:hypothetical protein [Candidatus Falkowbacteria bacterium]